MDWAEIRDDAAEWCQGRNWYWRAALLLYLGYAGVRYIIDTDYGSWFSGITFGIHELGHVVFSPLGRFLMTAGGSFSQLAAPAAAGLVLARQRDYFGVGVAGAWLSFSMIELSRYVGDARAQQLPLLGLSDQPEHDWFYLLSTVGLLQQDRVLAFLLRAAGVAVLMLSLALSVWLCKQMAMKVKS